MKAKEYLSIVLSNSPFKEEDIAKYLNVDQSTVSKWKTGNRNCNSEDFEKILNIHGYSISDYINGIINKNVRVKFKRSNITNVDFNVIAKVNEIFANLDYMEGYLTNEVRFTTNKRN